MSGSCIWQHYTHKKNKFQVDFFLCVWILSFTTVYLFHFPYFLKCHYSLKTAHPQKLSFIEKVKLNSYTMFSKQKGFASHNCLAFGKQRRKEMPAREGQTNRASVWGIVIQIHTVASKVQHGNYHKQWVIFSLNNVQNFFLTFLIFPVFQFRLIFRSKKKQNKEQLRTKTFLWEGQHAPRRPETFIFYYSQHLLCTLVVQKSVWVSLEVNITTVSDMLFVALVLSSYMLSTLLYNFLWSSRLSSPNFEVKFWVVFLF